MKILPLLLQLWVFICPLALANTDCNPINIEAVRRELELLEGDLRAARESISPDEEALGLHYLTSISDLDNKNETDIAGKTRSEAEQLLNEKYIIFKSALEAVEKSQSTPLDPSIDAQNAPLARSIAMNEAVLALYQIEQKFRESLVNYMNEANISEYESGRRSVVVHIAYKKYLEKAPNDLAESQKKFKKCPISCEKGGNCDPASQDRPSSSPVKEVFQ